MKTPLSLRTQLLLLVGGPLFLLVLLESLVSYRIGVHTANLVFDRWLLESVYALAKEVDYHGEVPRFAPDAHTLELIEFDTQDRVYYQVVDAEQRLVGGSSALQPPARNANLGETPLFRNLEVEGVPVRAVSIARVEAGRQPVVVTVAETLQKRQAMTSDLLSEVLVSKALLLVAVLVIVSAAFVKGLRPLVRLGRELAQRTPQDLTPIQVGLVPDEVRGLVENTNQLLARLDAAIGAREQFIGNIAHQIRTPLAGMKLQAQLAQDENDPAEVKQALERISHAADNMAHVNSQLMKLARAEAAFGRGLRRADIDLAGIVRGCCAELGARAVERGIKLQTSLPDTPVDIPGERTLLAEMVRNLVDNAILYGRHGGHVWVSVVTGAMPGSVTLVVEDDGPGIGREHWPYIFERFFRPSGSTGEGCGLGLSIVREIALAHGATVRLEDGGAGIGARFVVSFGG